MICRDQPQRPHLPQPTQAALPSLLRQALEAADERAFCEAATSHKYSIAGAFGLTMCCPFGTTTRCRTRWSSSRRV